MLFYSANIYNYSIEWSVIYAETTKYGNVRQPSAFTGKIYVVLGLTGEPFNVKMTEIHIQQTRNL